MNITNMPNLKEKPYGGAWSIHDKQLLDHRKFVHNLWNENEWDKNEIKHNYFDMFKSWISESHNIKGFELYEEACFTQATTESFAHFFIRFGHRRIRIAKGEYFYHNMMVRLYDKRFTWLDEDDLKPGDAVVLSVPFSDTGDVPGNLEEILTECDLKKIPVMIDLAYINLAKGLTFDLSHDCIEYVVSSLSKAFPLELSRIGIRLQKKKFEDQLYVINEDGYNYINFFSVYMGYHMMKEWNASWLYDKYKPLQDKYCEKLEVEPSSCVIFGIDTNNKYPEYNRGGETNRLCFSRVWDGRNIAKREWI